MTDGLLSYYSGQMIVCAIWVIPCVLLLLGTLALITVIYKPQWRTQWDQRTGMKYTGMRTYLIGWSIWWFWAPALTGLAFTIVHLYHEGQDFIAAHPWLPTFALIGAIAVPVAGAVGFGIWWWSRRTPRVQQWQPVPQSPVTPMQPYSRPYGEAGSEQVVR